MYLLMAITLGLLLWLFLVWPGKSTAAQRAPFAKRNFAHRGLHAPDKSVPENSLPAFAAAVQAGYGMELDVQLSRDGQVVVFHDDTLGRVTGAEGRVDSLPLAGLQQLRLCGGGETIPLFSTVLATVGGKAPLIVELKSGPRNAELCEKTLALLRGYEGPFCVESFDPTIVAWFRKNAPDILRGQLANPARDYELPLPLAFALSHCLGNVLARPQFIAWGGGRPNVCVQLARALGAMGVYWTARPADSADALQAHWDAVIFEHYAPSPRY